MKYFYSLVVLLIFLVSCSNNQNDLENRDSNSLELDNEIIKIASKYVTEQIPENEKTVKSDGTISIGNKNFHYEINPGNIYTGLINEDLNEDVIVLLIGFSGQYQTVFKHLILIKKGTSFELVKVLDDNMRILSIKNKIITAEVSSMVQDSPLSDCHLCKDTVNFEFREGKMLRIE